MSRQRNGLKMTVGVDTEQPINVPFCVLSPPGETKASDEAASSSAESVKKVEPVEAKAARSPRRKKAPATKANRRGTVSAPYVRQRDQVETVQVTVTLPADLRRQLAVYCAERDLKPSQGYEQAVAEMLKRG